MKSEPVFDHEKLQVYNLELEFLAWVTKLFGEVHEVHVPHQREVLDQLDRASLSALLNTAEGNGKRQGPQRAKFFDDARGSAVESAACLDAMVAKSMVTFERVADGQALLLRIVSMLCKLVDRFDQSGYRLRDDQAETFEEPK